MERQTAVALHYLFFQFFFSSLFLLQCASNPLLVELIRGTIVATDR
uniref:Uncharacterized protein n=1 Tax=Arundo donax TaxID=35708 RepID=A0A0A8Z2B1_ARUDO